MKKIDFNRDWTFYKIEEPAEAASVSTSSAGCWTLPDMPRVL